MKFWDHNRSILLEAAPQEGLGMRNPAPDVRVGMADIGSVAAAAAPALGWEGRDGKGENLGF